VSDRPLVAVVGPTAAGKSALALRIARAFSGEIVSCDSLQVYRGLDIGSAKPSPEERRLVPHHLIDVVDPGEEFSAAEYARRARGAIQDIAARGRLPVVVGGTGLYLKALLEGLFEGPARDEDLRGRLEGQAREKGDAYLHRVLARVDPPAAARIPPRDRVRVVRALEVRFRSGRTLSESHREGAVPLQGFETLIVGLHPDRSELRVAVERRTQAMIGSGLLDEVRGLLDCGLDPGVRPLQAIGYRQAVARLQGTGDEADLRRDIVTATMRYAKRQMTWFRHQAAVAWPGSTEQAFRFTEAWLTARRTAPPILDPPAEDA
jgi:tRNA dimethylallyltransferase